MISRRTKALAFFGAGSLILALAWLQAFRSWTLHRIESAGGGWDMSNIEVWGPMGWQHGVLLFLSYSGMAALAASAFSVLWDITVRHLKSSRRATRS